MIGTIDIKIQAENPQMPLCPFFAFVGSPSSVRILNVPRKIGDWAITKVFISANYPDNTIRSRECKLVGGVFVGTLPACSVVGKSLNGFSVTADGIDENGNAVEGYILGKGDLEIQSADGTVTPGITTHYIHVVPSRPENPQKYDAYTDSGTWYCYNGSEWVTLGGVSAGNAYILAPTDQGGDGLWHRMMIVDGTIAYDSEGIAEPPLAADKPWVLTQVGAVSDALNAHKADKTNPHEVTKAQVGLGNVDNTSDADKPVSTAQRVAIDAEKERAQRAEGDLSDALNAHKADKTNPHEVTKAQVGLGNVDNTSDANKPVSTAQAAAIAAEASRAQGAEGNLSDAIAAEKSRAEGAEGELNDAIVNEAARAAAKEATKVPLSGAAIVSDTKTFTSSPLVPTPSGSDNSPKAANTEWVNVRVSAWWAATLASGVVVPATWLFASRIFQQGTFGVGGLRTVFDDVERNVAPSSTKYVQVNLCGHTDAQNLMMLLMLVDTTGQRSISLRAVDSSGNSTDFITGILSMDGTVKRVKLCNVPLEDVGTPTAPSHAATKGYVDGLNYGDAAMPGATAVSLTLPESGNNIEFSTGVTAAPYACYVSLVKSAANAGEYITLESGAVLSTVYASAASQTLRTYIPVAKGATVKVSYTASGTALQFLRATQVKGITTP